MMFSKTIPILRIFDVAKAKEFYVDFLGFSIDWEYQVAEGSPVYLQISRENLIFHLSEHHGDCCPGAAVFIEMVGLEAFHQEITAKEYPYIRPGIEETPYQAKCIDVIDPFGNRLSFNEFMVSD
jgi:catechol 2,3-dioxygenase-like lactoylglutathione lyase family enzyme